ncbi:MAG: right-handed parallel beta-helix repeat-containing protein [Pseudomonadota bacterium]
MALAAGILAALLLPGTAAAAVLAVGPGKFHATPCSAFAAAGSGDTIEIAAGTYRGDVCAIHAHKLLIRGVNGRPIIDAAGRHAMGKGTWVVLGHNITIENVEMLGAKVPDRNGAALRLEGTGFTLRGSYLHDNENGILGGANAASDILIETSEFSRNGFGTGQTHNVYIGTVRSLVFRYNYTHDAHVGHNLKSRAQSNQILYNRFSGTGLGQPSYEIDLPNAGLSRVSGNVIRQPAANQNATLLSYGAEGASNASDQLCVSDNAFINDDPVRGIFIQLAPSVATPAFVQNNVFVGKGGISGRAVTQRPPACAP